MPEPFDTIQRIAAGVDTMSDAELRRARNVLDQWADSRRADVREARRKIATRFDELEGRRPGATAAAEATDPGAPASHEGALPGQRPPDDQVIDLPGALLARGVIRLLNTAGGRVLCLAGAVDVVPVESFVRRYGREPVRVDGIDAGSVTSLSPSALELLLDHLEAAERDGRQVALRCSPLVAQLMAFTGDLS